MPLKDFKCPLCRQTLVLPSPWAGSYKLPDMDAIAFGVYVEWLYNGPSRNSSSFDSDTTRRAYILGEKLEAEDFCRYLLSAFAMRFMQVQKCPGHAFVNFIYRDTRPDSAMRRLTVNMWAEIDQPNLVYALANGADLPVAFQQDLVIALMKRRAEPPVWDLEDLEAGKARLLSWS